MDYSLDSLEEKFTEHAKILREQFEAQKKQHDENGWETPEYYKENFSLPEAFITIVREIKKLKGE